MPGGRPAKEHQRHEHCEPLAEWFARSLDHAGYRSINQFLNANRLLTKHLVYDLANAVRPLRLPEVRVIATALGRPPEEATDLWWTARRTMERLAAGEAASDGPISWDDIPAEPFPQVRDLLEAQRDRVDVLPYAKLGVKPPPLATVYVQQQVNHREAAEGDPSDAPGRTIPGIKAFDGHEHLLITGEAGSGKSTFGNRIADGLISRWLHESGTGAETPLEPLVPLVISARDLIGDSPWTTTIAASVTRSLGVDLRTEFVPELLASRVHGARWLLIIDALDEVRDPDQRRRVIRAIARHGRQGENFRILVCSRALPDDEFVPLKGVGFGHFALCPFTRADLQDFADRWFKAQSPTNGAELTKTYLRRVTQGGLAELVTNPLLATITAVVETRDPGAPLPADRIGLYERFYRYLVEPRLSQRLATESMDTRRDELFELLANAEISGEPLLPAARTWSEQGKADAQPGDDAEITLRNELIDTGLFVFDGSDVRFLHYSFAEFLAAKGIARGFGTGRERLYAWLWVHRGRLDANIPIFTTMLWGRRAGNDLGEFISAILGRSSEMAHFAGILLANGSVVPEQVEDAVIRRLGALSMTSSMTRPFSALARMHGNDKCVRYLKDLYEHQELAPGVRAHVAMALFRLLEQPIWLDRLTGLLEHADAMLRHEIAVALSELPSPAADLAPRLLGEPAAIAWPGPAARLLHRSGHHEAAREVLGLCTTTSNFARFWLDSIGWTWIEVNGAERAHELLEHLGPNLPGHQRSVLAMLFTDHGLDDLAIEQIGRLFTDGNGDGKDYGRAVWAWYRLGGTNEEIQKAVQGLRGLHAGDRIALASWARAPGLEPLVAELLVDSCVPDLCDEDAKSLGELWGDREAEEVRLLVDAVVASGEMAGRQLAEIAVGLASRKHLGSTITLARAVLEGDTPLHFNTVGHAVGAWLTAGGSREIVPITAALREHMTGMKPYEQKRIAAEVAESLPEFAAGLVRELLGAPGSVPISELCEILLRSAGVAAVTETVSLLGECSARELKTLAKLFAVNGIGDPMIPFVQLLRHPKATSEDVVTAAQVLLNLNYRDAAIQAIRETLALGELRPPQENHARATLAWLTYLRPGTPTCGVPTCTGLHAHSEAAPHP